MTFSKISRLVFIRIIVLILTSILLSWIIPFSGNFPYREVLEKSYVPSWIFSWGNFDGVHFAKIAANGYDQYEQAFFPLYPLIIRFFTHVLQSAAMFGNYFFGLSRVVVLQMNYVFVGVLASWTFFILGTFTFSKLMKKLTLKNDTTTPLWTVFFLLLFPTSFYFQSVYTESLFLFLLSTSLFLLFYSSNSLLLRVFVFLTALTRIQGILVIVPMALYYFIEAKGTSFRFKMPSRGQWLTLLTPCIGLGVYMTYLYSTTGDPLMFYSSQSIFNATRSTQIILLPQVLFRYMKIYFTAQLDMTYLIAVNEGILFMLASVLTCIHFIQSWKQKNIIGLSIAVFSAIQIILPTLTGTLSSIPRYILFAYSMYYVLAQISNQKYKVAVATVFVLWQVLLATLFIQGYFVA